MAGYIIIPRDLFSDKMFKKGKANETFAFIDLIQLAEYEDSTTNIKGQIVQLKRGDLSTSIRVLSERWGWSANAVTHALDTLERYGKIKRRKSNLTSVISIVNYDAYQTISNAKSNAGGIAESNADKDKYNDINGINGINEEKDANASKEKRKRFVPPTVEEVRDYADSIGYSSLNADGFVDYYATRGWKLKGNQPIKDWKACVRTWKRKDEEKGVLFPDVQAEKGWHIEGATYYKDDFVAQKKMAEFWALDGTMKKRMDNGEAVVWENGKFRMKF